MIYFNYFLTNKSGVVSVIVLTGTNLISEYESEIFSLLNGLVDLSLEKPPPTVVEKQTDDDIESKLIKLKNMQDITIIVFMSCARANQKV